MTTVSKRKNPIIVEALCMYFAKKYGIENEVTLVIPDGPVKGPIKLHKASFNDSTFCFGYQDNVQNPKFVLFSTMGPQKDHEPVVVIKENNGELTKSVFVKKMDQKHLGVIMFEIDAMFAFLCKKHGVLQQEKFVPRIEDVLSEKRNPHSYNYY